jgi:hypothetical protein
MSSRGRLLTLLGLILLVAIGWVISWALENEVIQTSSPAEVAMNFEEGSCEGSGVSVVVDFGAASEKETIVRCAKDFFGTGWDIFLATDLIVEGTKQYPVGFVCRIENFPNPTEQDCQDTPKYSEGTWGYFFLDKEVGWRVSGTGSASRTPECGSAEGWLFLAPGEQAGELTPSITPEITDCG